MASMNDGAYFSTDREGRERSSIQLHPSLCFDQRGATLAKCLPCSPGLKERGLVLNPQRNFSGWSEAAAKRNYF